LSWSGRRGWGPIEMEEFYFCGFDTSRGWEFWFCPRDFWDANHRLPEDGEQHLDRKILRTILPWEFDERRSFCFIWDGLLEGVKDRKDLDYWIAYLKDDGFEWNTNLLAHRQRAASRRKRTGCLHKPDGCEAFGVYRGLCVRHYNQAKYSIGRGETTWKKLERSGACLPQRRGRDGMTPATRTAAGMGEVEVE